MKKSKKAEPPKTDESKSGNLASHIRMEYHVDCSTCKAIREWVREIENIGYKQFTIASLKAILAAGDPSAKETGSWTGNYKWEPQK